MFARTKSVVIAADATKSLVRATPRIGTPRYRRCMGGNAVFVWIILGLAVAVLILIALYVDSWRRKDDA
ncbi:hypothetical protein GCM10007977_044240 [Dactylosporangium sucinum]|uniref:Uncharacterized protein n=1 Tax=Dactylosporangium sucinum TaxID=1424081 RepID=A0A917TTZ4_9ACTN|nr:hypothetical protein GCM10007977_044240 [Dactylosporangium sucinum]